MISGGLDHPALEFNELFVAHAFGTGIELKPKLSRHAEFRANRRDRIRERTGGGALDSDADVDEELASASF